MFAFPIMQPIFSYLGPLIIRMFSTTKVSTLIVKVRELNKRYHLYMKTLVDIHEIIEMKADMNFSQFAQINYKIYIASYRSIPNEDIFIQFPNAVAVIIEIQVLASREFRCLSNIYHPVVIKFWNGRKQMIAIGTTVSGVMIIDNIAIRISYCYTVSIDSVDRYIYAYNAFYDPMFASPLLEIPPSRTTHMDTPVNVHHFYKESYIDIEPTYSQTMLFYKYYSPNSPYCHAQFTIKPRNVVDWYADVYIRRNEVTIQYTYKVSTEFEFGIVLKPNNILYIHVRLTMTMLSFGLYKFVPSSPLTFHEDFLPDFLQNCHYSDFWTDVSRIPHFATL
ncbi:MAG: hypothetical protein GY694_17180 [Gammaproteobacteria bacterium]|nr:hypothetical protein [Gammaproteobacteria bacterium]